MVSIKVWLKIKLGDILLIETLQAPTLTQSLEADEVITLKSVNSLATSLACSYTTEQSLKYYKDQSLVKSQVELIDDIDSLRACVAFENVLVKLLNQLVEQQWQLFITKLTCCTRILNICNQKILLLLLYVAVHVLQGLILKGLKK